MLTNLRLAQIYAVLRLELKKTFLARRGVWVYLLAFSPILLYGGHSLLMIKQGRPCDFGLDTTIFATVFQIFYLRLAVFFGCLGIFMNLFRGEVLDKSLHFYFLAPIRREVLLAGKFLAGLCVAICTYCLSIVLQFFAMYAHYDLTAIQDYLWRNQGIQHLAAYLAVTALACIGYGSVFLAAGILMRNPLIPAAVMLVWESANPFLPSLLQKFSVLYYLKSLCPIEANADAPPPLRLLIVNAAPMSPYLAVPGLLIVATLIVLWAGIKIRRMEISYSTD
jgi:ABC-type transport system involved in multi-copper enzyme maturation permease subunit